MELDSPLKANGINLHTTLVINSKLSLEVKRSFLAFLGASFILVACSVPIVSSVAPNANVQALKTFYIVQNEEDERDVYKAIQAELESMGRQVTVGSRSSVPRNVDAIITYHAYWHWGPGWNLRHFLIQLRNPRTNVLVASAMSSSTIGTKGPELMAREDLESILK